MNEVQSDTGTIHRQSLSSHSKLHFLIWNAYSRVQSATISITILHLDTNVLSDCQQLNPQICTSDWSQSSIFQQVAYLWFISWQQRYLYTWCRCVHSMKFLCSDHILFAARLFEEAEQNGSTTPGRFKSALPRLAAEIAKSYKVELNEMRRILQEHHPKLPPERFDETNAELLRFAASAGLLEVDPLLLLLTAYTVILINTRTTSDPLWLSFSSAPVRVLLSETGHLIFLGWTGWLAGWLSVKLACHDVYIYWYPW